MHKTTRIAVIFGFFIPTLFFLTVFILIINIRNIQDWWSLMDYQPDENIVQIADNTTMTDFGRKLFYVYHPEINDKETFNKNCPIKELTYVLGCYDSLRIFLLDIQQPELEKVEEVTGAHEMLHAAYERLSRSERERIDGLTSAELKKSQDQDLIRIIAKYREANPKSVPNELHSIIGTEVENISPELEEYYSQYFDDRKKVVSINKQYSDVFKSLEQQAKNLDLEMKNIKATMDNIDAQLIQKDQELNRINSLLDSYSASGNYVAYNRLVPSQNSIVYSYNDLVEQYKKSVQMYNEKVEQYNATVVRQESLVHSIDSKYQDKTSGLQKSN
jgi:hypothetical protein